MLELSEHTTKKKNRLYAYFIFFFLVMSSTVLGVKPITQTETDVGDKFEIEYPKIINVIQGDDIELDFYVFNSTGKLLIGSEVSCRYKHYLLNGSEVHDELALAIDDHFQIHLNNTITDRLGVHEYLIYCNDSLDGGFVSTGFEVTVDGKDHFESDSENQWLLYFVILLVYCVLYG